MHDEKRTWIEIITFLGLTLVLSSIFWVMIIAKGGLGAAGSGAIFGLMWCPGIAGLITRLAFRRNLRGLGWGWGATRYQGLSYSLPFLYALVAYAVVWLVDLGDFYNQQTLRSVADQVENRFGIVSSSDLMTLGIYVVLVATYVVGKGCLYALGEEIGWRGLLVPKLAEVTTLSKTAWLSGIIWAVWHYPLILLVDYRGAGPVWYSLLCFTLLCVTTSFCYAWLRLRSNSLWTAVLMHATHNAFIQSFFDPITEPTRYTEYAIGEFGIAVPAVVGVFAYLFWRRRGELPRAAS